MNSKLGRQHTKAPLAAALSPLMSLLYPPDPWCEWCDEWRLTTTPGSTSPTLFEQWCGFFTSHKNQTSVSTVRRDLLFFVLIGKVKRSEEFSFTLEKSSLSVGYFSVALQYMATVSLFSYMNMHYDRREIIRLKTTYVILFGFELKKVSNKEWSSQLWTQFMQLCRKPENPEPVNPEASAEAWIRDLAIPLRCSNRCSESLLRKRRVQLPQDWFVTPTWPPFNSVLRHQYHCGPGVDAQTARQLLIHFVDIEFPIERGLLTNLKV